MYLLNSHGRVLDYFSRNSAVTYFNAALQIGLRERTLIAIVSDLEEAGMMSTEKKGRNIIKTVKISESLKSALQAVNSVNTNGAKPKE